MITPIISACKNNLRDIFVRPQHNNKSIDGLRAIAILYVLIFHCFFFTQYAFAEKQEFLNFINGLPLILHWVWQGDKGVDIFFVISGFLIGQHLMQEFKRNSTVNIKRFYLKRIFRIMPLYVFAIILYGSTGKGNAEYFWANLLLINNFLSADKMFIPWSWSLTIEGQFYVIAPLLIYILYKTKSYFFSLISLFIFANIVRLFLLQNDPEIYTNTLVDYFLNDDKVTAIRYLETLYINLYTRMGPIILGIIAAYIDTYHKEKAIYLCSQYTKTHTTIIIFLFTVLIFITSRQVFIPSSSVFFNEGQQLIFSTIGRNLFSAVITILMLSAFYQSGLLSRIVNRFLSSKIWFPISQTSFSLYLFHIPFIFLAFYLIKGKEKIHFIETYEMLSVAILALLFSFIFGVLTFILLERPFMKIGKRKTNS